VKALHWSYFCAFVLALLPSLASADEPFTWAKNRVDESIVKPVSARERGGGFSRGRPPPRQSRIRITQPSESRDPSNRAFVAFAIDVRWGASSEWNKDDVVGCVYRESGKVFVKIGDSYRPAAILLGKDVEPVAGVCVAAPPPPPPPPSARS
jgi:hypothetical protein